MDSRLGKRLKKITIFALEKHKIIESLCTENINNFYRMNWQI